MSTPIRVVFVCWGNICRSPMAERVAEGYAQRHGIAGVEFSSAGVSAEELGNPIDPRATRVLEDHGYRADRHRAHRITAEEIDAADLVVSMEDLHTGRMRRLHPRRTDHLHLLTDFDPDAERGSGVPDPWYGDADGFDDTLASVEAAMPGVFEEIERIRASR
ncbi:low molecular weight phosphotyrosine protein phosphatase [Naumannella sp. ID2617S]|nr:low molecular weight phosphotyrosine protein phosphatase [Naumannella sp. ID2617S]